MAEIVYVTLSIDPPRRYGVRFNPDGNAEVWTIWDQAPVNRRGFYQSEQNGRSINPNGPTGLRAIAAAADQLNTRHALTP